MRAVCYARVSSAAQRERDTIASQLRDLPALVAREGWTLTRPASTYVDDGRTAKSGHLDKRPGLDALMRDAARGEFDIVVVVDVDRLTRSEDLIERALVMGTFQRAGVVIATVSGKRIDPRTSEGDLLGMLDAYAAANWLRQHRARVTAGKLTAISRGRKPSGPTPFGLAYERATHAWSIDPIAGDVVREIFHRVTAGDTCNAIADDLHARGLRLPRGGEWSRGRVHQLVQKRTYVGEWLADKARGLVVRVPAILTEQEWQAARDSLRRRRKSAGRRARHVYLLEQLARCSTCGAPIWIRSAASYVAQGERRRSPAAYQCSRRKEPPRGAPPCTEPPVWVRDLDERVWQRVIEEIADPTLVAAIARRTGERSDEVSDWQGDAAGYRKHLERLERHEGGMLARARRGAISEGALDAELAAIRREREVVREQLAGAERGARAGVAVAARLDGLTATLQALRAHLPDASPAQRRRVLEALVAPGSVVLQGGRIKMTMVIRAPRTARSHASDVVSSDGCSPGYRSVTPEDVRLRVVA